MRISTKRILVLLFFFILLNGGYGTFGMHVLPLYLPVLECPSMPATVHCNMEELQLNLASDWVSINNSRMLFASIFTVVVIGVVFGRALCGWVCPLGFFQDLLAFVPRLVKRKQKEVSEKLHFILTSVKYMVLSVTLGLVVSVGISYAIGKLLGYDYRYRQSLGVCGSAPYCIVCPVPFLFVTLPSLIRSLFLGAPFEPPQVFTFYIGFVVFMFLLFSSIMINRAWCRYTCPVGALMSLFSRFSLLHIRKNPNKCTAFCRGHQRDCNKACPMGIKVSRNQEPSSDPECILCNNCAEYCSNNAIKCKLGR